MTLLGGETLYYDFEPANVSGASVTDVTGLGHTGTIVAPAATAAGIIGDGAIQFGTSASSRVSANHATDIQPGTGDFSVSLWLARGSTGNVQHRLAVKRSGNQWWDVSIIGFGGGAAKIITVNVTSNYPTTAIFAMSAGDIADMNPHHVAFVFDRDANLTVWVDGVAGTPVASSADTGNIANTAALSIGSYYGTGNFFDGRIDDVRIFQRVLSAPEIAALASNTFVNIPACVQQARRLRGTA